MKVMKVWELLPVAEPDGCSFDDEYRRGVSTVLQTLIHVKRTQWIYHELFFYVPGLFLGRQRVVTLESPVTRYNLQLQHRDAGGLFFYLYYD